MGTDGGGGMLTEPESDPTLGAVGFFFGNVEFSLGLWAVISGI